MRARGSSCTSRLVSFHVSPTRVPLHACRAPAHSGSNTAAVKNSTANPDRYETTHVCGIARMPQTCVFVSYLDLQLNSSPLLSGYSLHELGSHATGLHQHPLVLFEQPLRLGLVPARRTNTRRQSSSRRHRHVVMLYPLILREAALAMGRLAVAGAEGHLFSSIMLKFMKQPLASFSGFSSRNFRESFCVSSSDARSSCQPVQQHPRRQSEPLGLQNLILRSRMTMTHARTGRLGHAVLLSLAYCPRGQGLPRVYARAPVCACSRDSRSAMARRAVWCAHPWPC